MADTLPLGQLLRELRRSQNRSLDQVAGLVSQAAGAPVTRDQVQLWEAGTQTPARPTSGTWPSRSRSRCSCWRPSWPRRRPQPGASARP